MSHESILDRVVRRIDAIAQSLNLETTRISTGDGVLIDFWQAGGKLVHEGSTVLTVRRGEFSLTFEYRATIGGEPVTVGGQKSWMYSDADCWAEYEEQLRKGLGEECRKEDAHE
jgi:hypothetical protein